MKFSRPILIVCAIVALMSFISANAQDDSAAPQKSTAASELGVKPDAENMSFKIHGWGSYEFGEIVSGHMANDNRIEKIWRQRVYANLKGDMTVSDRIHMVIAPEVLMYSRYPVNETQTFREDIKAQYAIYLDEAYFSIALGNITQPFLGFKVGYFKFKYNPDVRDLGEYMFRSGCYPTFVTTVFDHAFQRLLGLNISSNLFDSLWHQDLIINSHTEFFPRDDYNLSYFSDITPIKGLTIGAGIQFDRLLPTASSKTRPITPANQYYKSSSIDPGTGQLIYPDTGYYTFAGTKIMGRLNFDPKLFFRDVNIFGPNDLKLYGEFAILGFENQVNVDTSSDRSVHPYEHVSERIPYMIGFNVPTFKVLDVLSLEIQNWDNPWANEYTTVRRTYLPLRYKTNGWGNRRNDNFKWSVYLKKTFLDHFSIIAAVAKDNLLDIDETEYEPLADYEETYRYPGDWYWRFKVQGEF
jgi:hypothetical protein